MVHANEDTILTCLTLVHGEIKEAGDAGTVGTKSPQHLSHRHVNTSRHVVSSLSSDMSSFILSAFSSCLDSSYSSPSIQETQLSSLSTRNYNIVVREHPPENR